MSTALRPALNSSMNEFIKLVVEPSLTRNSLILMRLTLRTFWAVFSDCVRPFAVHVALPTRSPLKNAGPDVTLKVAPTVAPGATVSFVNADTPVAVHWLGTPMLNLRPVTTAPVVFVNVTVTFWEDPGENVWSPGFVAAAGAG